ncbi:MAG: hypothetical protein FJ387_16920 [Verrucomicrobia bacterium]|nr:hypothetical protein [Verrucomicrobiota bacterium]
MQTQNTVRRAHGMGAPAAATLLAAVGWVTALAQPEQWLAYHSGPEPKAYRWIELSTDAPEGVALPKLGSGAHYGQWANGFETGGGRWFALDRTRRSGPCDRLYFDTNGDGRLDDETPREATRRMDSMAYFEPIKLVFKTADGPISYHLVMRFYQSEEERARLLAGAAGWYEGRVTLAGKKRSVQLLDNTVNGTFDDTSESPSEADRITVDGEEDGFTRYLGRYLEVDGQLLRLEVARDGAFIKVAPAEGVVLGSVQVPDTISEFTAVGPSGHFIRKPDGGEFKLPVGKYRVNGWEVNRTDDRGAKWTLSGYSFGPTAQFEVRTDHTARVQAGEPVFPALQITEGKSDLAFSLRLVGPLGETLQILRGTERPRAPQLQVSGTGFSATRTFEYG